MDVRKFLDLYRVLYSDEPKLTAQAALKRVTICGF